MEWKKNDKISLSKQDLYDSIMNDLKFISGVLQNNHHTNSMEKMTSIFRELKDLMEYKDTKKKKDERKGVTIWFT